MRRLLAALLAAAAAAGCGEQTSSADAARADSSAAGYAVGAHREPALVAARTDSGIRLPADSAPRAAAPGVTPAVTTPSPSVTTAPGQSVRDSARTATKPATAPNVATRPPHTDTAAPLPAGPVRVNEFLTYDGRSRTVSLQLIAGYNGLNGSLNYNGATNGSHGVYIPTGWRIHVAVTNRDSDLQHSAIVVQKILPPPIEPSEPAFPAAALPQLAEGLQEDETGTLDFVADRAGQYMIACGVPGHAQAGMWLQLAVSNGLKVPAYR